ncbi:beta-galactosidase BglB [Parasphaerochaeta coccoides]|uniref:Glycosyl hydrolase family 88 n=1 Tax=Parasphaerochaeta coccoides (strain ATCC BAA-1237 / DSM 17374 / SPN1) TaxID=760011 RepID=F4GM16_PARC1|nr:glycoside hydrolase family 88 protein [Parasphaerochaeta coccoides]AEC02491.1 glycosyl hydrolase family 88 [Parasphaerochaeta coccoides DSM 17374]
MNTCDTKSIQTRLDLLVAGFAPVLYADDDPDFMAGKIASHHDGTERERFRYWEWPHGIGLFGLWKLFEKDRNPRYLDMLTTYYDQRIAQGLPDKNVNTMAPILALSYLAEHTGRADYMDICREWTGWVMEGGLDRTEEGGFQHSTSDDINEGELWDDTLMMTVLAVANVGRITGKDSYVQEAIYQFLLHAEYLADIRTGLWYHGFTFKGKHHFSEAFWGRGNCWATIAIPEFIRMVELPGSIRRYLVAVLERQVNALHQRQDAGGMWHTLLDDPSSYLETSATCGFGYGILKSIHSGLLNSSYKDMALKALPAILSHIDENGIVRQVSYGTPMGRHDKDFYKNIPIRPMPYGQALAMLFLMEAMVD